MSFLKKLKIFDFSFYGFSQLINLFTPLLVAPHLISVCGEENFGKIGMALSFVFILIVLVDFSSGINGVRDVSLVRGNKSKIDDIVRTLYGVKIVALLTVLLLSLFIILIIPFFSRESLLFFLSMSILVGQAINPSWLLQGMDAFRAISFMNLLNKGIYILLIIIFIKEEEDYIFVNLYFGLSSFMVFCIMNLWMISNNIITIKRPDYKSMKELYKRDFKLTFSQLLLSLQQYSPVILVGYFAGDFTAGIYKIIEQIIMIFRTYLQVFFSYVYPKICYNISKSYRLGVQNWLYFNLINFGVVSIMAIVFYMYNYDILSYFNVDHVNSLIPIFNFALLIPIVFAISIPLQQLILAFGKQRQYVNITSLTAFMLIALIPVFLNFFDLKGVFATILLIDFIVILSYLYTLRKSILSTFHEN